MPSNFIRGVAYDVGSTMGVPTQSLSNNRRMRQPSQSEIRRMKPTGGKLAINAGLKNPYLTPNGYRKPSQSDIITEIAVFSGLQNDNNVTRCEDSPPYIRHCCTTKPYMFVLPAMRYAVNLPDTSIEVIYYVHKECNKLQVVAGTLS